MNSVPATTYRIQFNADFTLSDLDQLIPYFQQLGIGAIYASPIFRAVPASVHGYDQTNPLEINPEIGSLEQLRAVAGKLAAAGIGWIQDIVPNHMAYHPENTWLWDVLENGPDSPFSKFFDAPYGAPDYFQGRLMLPFLDAPLDEVIVAGRLTIQIKDDTFFLDHNGQHWPINAAGSSLIRAYLKEHRGSEETEAGPEIWPETLIREIVACQYYEPCYWKDTESRINYRRFFTVNGLIALNTQDDRVFGLIHQLIAQLVREGVFTGLRIDHVDGLADPSDYLVRLRQLVGENTYVVVEKILQQEETLPTVWPVQGTTGYDFLAMVNGLLADGNNERRLSRFYDKLVGRAALPLLLTRAKRTQLHTAMEGELDNLAHFFRVAVWGGEKLPGPLSQAMLKSALASFVIHCPVYRWYGRTFPLPEPEAEEVRQVFQQAALAEPELREGLSFLESALVPSILTAKKRPAKHLADFYQRCMQLTGALMAKGLEDTLMYTYHRYIGANEVGGAPAVFSFAIADFHRSMQQRAGQYPYSLNATATHDTKRGEDVRARLQTLTAFPHTWMRAVKSWMNANVSYKTSGMPDVNDEYFIYQTLWGTFPMPGQSVSSYRGRLEAYLIKALREAKRHTDWTSPDLTYEEATHRFIRNILRPHTTFLQQFGALHRELADVAILNSLTQVVLKFTCPGVPDVYQGCEGWDLSFVDPDNRRKVDFTMRRKWQQRLKRIKRSGMEEVTEWWNERYSGLLKYAITERLAQMRLSNKAALQGDYEPVVAMGKQRKHVLAFTRRLDGDWLLVVVPIHINHPLIDYANSAKPIDWGDTWIRLPEGAPRQWRNVVTDEVCETAGALRLNQALQRLPIGVWTASEETRKTQRGAGVLLPLFSLPGPYGIGDLGPEAYRFADFLRGARQRYWLMLPHHPTDEGVNHSPYSTHSAMAGNTLLISLDEFQRNGWITERELTANHLPDSDHVAYAEARALKHFFFGKAFRNYLQQWGGQEDPQFGDFCTRESAWLDDYADYEVLRERYQGKPWYNWPRAYRNRDEQALAAFRRKHAYALQQAKWLQYQFFGQWQRLKMYCNHAGIELIGDLPFYINHDSVDVWAHPELFRLDSQGRMSSMAGVPPDYFNVEGQNWGMPIYQWENHVVQGYEWWIARIRKNLGLYDLLRLDHFRAFYDYWEIPKGAETAKEGTWQAGPGIALFHAIKNALGALPFIAEDLGDIHEGVYRLRDELGLPGMKVLQFAFGDDVGTNLHVPHLHTANDVVFTGTHDNNTVAGWYQEELQAKGKAQLTAYVGTRRLNPQQASSALCRMAYASPAWLAILPMQDLLGLRTEARMNVPAAPQENWQWRLRAKHLTDHLQQKMTAWVRLYGR